MAPPVMNTQTNTKGVTDSTNRQMNDRLILIADDAPDNRTLLEVILQRAGARTAFAVDGFDVISKTLELKPDAIIMDIQMPGIDGYTATAKLRELGYKGAIISCTARAMLDDLPRSIRAGCNAHLTKPLQRAELLKMLNGLWTHQDETESHIQSKTRH